MTTKYKVGERFLGIAGDIQGWEITIVGINTNGDWKIRLDKNINGTVFNERWKEGKILMNSYKGRVRWLYWGSCVKKLEKITPTIRGFINGY